MTTAQIIASDPDFSVWVSASAGAGKTTVLTARVLRLLLSGTNPGKILCLTYTNAGAAEMECRIKKKLSTWVTVNDDELVRDLNRLTGEAPSQDTIVRARRLFLETLDVPDGIKIQTIHSFCQSLMRRFPLEAGIVPHFKIADDKTTEELLKNAYTKLLSNKVLYGEKVEEAVKNIFWRVRERSFAEVVRDIVTNRNRLEEAINSAGSTSNLKETLFLLLGVDETIDEDGLLASAARDENFDIEGLRNTALVMIEEKGIECRKYGNAILSWLELTQDERVRNFEKYQKVFLTNEGDMRKKILPVKSSIPPHYIADEQCRIYQLHKKIKATRVAMLTSGIIDIAEALLQIYSSEKSVMAALDYSDLIIRSNNLLSIPDISPWILYKLDGGIDHILLDEAQDTSPLQWRIIDSICSEFFSGVSAREENRTLFVVGDEKQSIFSFQGAAPEIFEVMQRKFKILVESSGKEWRQVRLDESFRSAPVILSSVDAVMRDVMPGKEVSHSAYHGSLYGRVEVWPLIEPEKKEFVPGWVMPLEYKDKQDTNKILAENIADTIKSWLDNGRILPSTGKKIRAGDIMILLRKRINMADNIISSLKSRNIPVAGHDRLVITEYIAVMDLISLGNFLLLPEDNLSLACVLKSPLIGFSEDDLFNIAYGRGKKSLWRSLQEKEDESEVNKFAVGYLSNLLKLIDFYTPFALFCHVIEALDGRKKFMQRLGEEANDPLDEFLAMAIQYEQLHPPSMQGFLFWVESGKTIIKRDVEQEGQNTVRVMTVHGSKGLEAPIVIMPDTTSSDSSNTGILWHEKEDGDVMLWPGVSANEEDICKGIKERNILKEKEEYYRLLYVAMTRAKYELYVAGAVGSKKVSERSWYSVIKNALSSVAIEDNSGKLVITNGTPLEFSVSEEQKKSEDYIIPEYLFTEPKPEPTPSRPLAPSKVEDGEEVGVFSPIKRDKMLEGKIIHSLLEFLPDVEEERRLEVGLRFLKTKFAYVPDLTNRADFILANILELINTDGLKDVFSANSKAEVPVVGIVDGVVVSGRIDRLCVLEDRVIIVDYKTGVPPKLQERINAAYLKQMRIYENLIGEIYQDKKVESYIIWVENMAIIKLSESNVETLTRVI